jgi:hypothetical protein
MLQDYLIVSPAFESLTFAGEFLSKIFIEGLVGLLRISVHEVDQKGIVFDLLNIFVLYFCLAYLLPEVL